MYMQRFAWATLIRVEEKTQTFVAEYDWHDLTIMQTSRLYHSLEAIAWSCMSAGDMESGGTHGWEEDDDESDSDSFSSPLLFAGTCALIMAARLSGVSRLIRPITPVR